MNQMQSTAILTSLIERMRQEGSWCGETHIQKAVFLLQELLRCPVGFEFILYKHGPFSFDLRDELTSLCADEILRMEPQAPPYGPKFSVTSSGEQLQKRYPKTLGEQQSRINFLAGVLGGKGVAELERLATALYVTLEPGAHAQTEERAQRLHDLKPHVPIDEARMAVEALDGMRREAETKDLI